MVLRGGGTRRPEEKRYFLSTRDKRGKDVCGYL